ncbi:unnamed protein product [Protopolystoma xenopodis]|uniref:Uncharacterized protein n=1 Tax=Protopolystoma xenopodis TaxID=117903 RepID=A0A3S5BRV7_9PLAT|nr:unnamed protein product [Protopolystoma xenopodis]
MVGPSAAHIFHIYSASSGAFLIKSDILLSFCLSPAKIDAYRKTGVAPLPAKPNATSTETPTAADSLVAANPIVNGIIKRSSARHILHTNDVSDGARDRPPVSDLIGADLRPSRHVVCDSLQSESSLWLDDLTGIQSDFQCRSSDDATPTTQPHQALRHTYIPPHLNPPDHLFAQVSPACQCCHAALGARPP